MIRRGLPHSRGSRWETVRWKQESARGMAGLVTSKNMESLLKTLRQYSGFNLAKANIFVISAGSH